MSSSGRCSHPHGLSQHRQCFVSHKGSSHPGSGALFGPRRPPPGSRKAPRAAPPQPAEVPRGTSVWLGWRDLAEVLTLRGRVLLIFLYVCVGLPVHVSDHECVCACVCQFMFMWAQAPGSWDSPSPDNKMVWEERQSVLPDLSSQWTTCPSSPAASHRLWNGVTLTRTNRWGERGMDGQIEKWQRDGHVNGLLDELLILKTEIMIFLWMSPWMMKHYCLVICKLTYSNESTWVINSDKRVTMVISVFPQIKHGSFDIYMIHLCSQCWPLTLCIAFMVSPLHHISWFKVSLMNYV